MGLTVPRSVAEQPVQGNAPFPAGHYVFTIEETGARSGDELPEFFFSRVNKAGEACTPMVASRDATELKVVFGQAQPLGDEPDPGDRKMFFDAIVQDGATHVNDVDVTGDVDGHGWLIQRSGRHLASLALALGATVEQGDYIAVDENFADLLEAGEYNGLQVVGEVFHDKRGKAAFAGFSAAP